MTCTSDRGMLTAFTVSLAPSDIAAAQALVLRHHPVRRIAPWAITIAGVAFGALLAFAAQHFQPELSQRQIVSTFAKGMTLTMLFLGGQYIMLLGIVGRIAQRLPDEPRVVEGRLGDAHLELIDNGRTDTISLAAIKQVIESPDLLILYRGSAAFHAFPKRQLDETVLFALKQALAKARSTP